MPDTPIGLKSQFFGTQDCTFGHVALTCVGTCRKMDIVAGFSYKY